MKKMIMILMMVFTMVTGLFAYEPKKECATIKGNKVYYEETYDVHKTWTKTRMWSYKIKSGKFIYYKSATFDYMWCELCNLRESYDLNLYIASFKDEKCSTCAFIEEYKSAYENNELSEEEMKQYEALVAIHGSANDLTSSVEGKSTHAETATKSYYEVCANGDKEKAIFEIPFVTEENWKTITKEELLDKILAFIEEVKAEAK